MRISCSGIRLAGILKLLPFQGDRLAHIIPRAMPWARGFCPFRAYGAYFQGVWGLLFLISLQEIVLHFKSRNSYN